MGEANPNKRYRYTLISHQFLRFENHKSHDQHLQVALLLQPQSRVACQSTLYEQPVKTTHNLGRSNVRKEKEKSCFMLSHNASTRLLTTDSKGI